MNRNSLRKKNKEPSTKTDVTGYEKVPMIMTFFKSNIVGGLIGFFSAFLMWMITLMIMPARYYLAVETHVTRSIYRIALKITAFLEQSGIIETLNYEQAIMVKNISCVIYVIGIILSLIVITILHEFVHKWVWQIGFDKNTRKNEFKIGIKKLTPYCHCKVDLTLRKMILGTIAPTIITGCLVMIMGAINKNPITVIIGALGVAAGGSDQLQVLMLLPYWKRSKKQKIICGDMEDEFGCVLFIESAKK